MPLADYKPPRSKVEAPGGVSFEVRALSLSDLSAIIRIHRDATEEIVAALSRHADAGGTVEAMINMVMTMIAEAPALLATVIAYASDEPDEAAAARNLPLTVSVEALNTIGSLTFSDIATLKKMIANAKELITGMIPTEMLALADAA